MSAPALAPRDKCPGHDYYHSQAQDPFYISKDPPHSVRTPPPCARLPTDSRHCARVPSASPIRTIGDTSHPHARYPSTQYSYTRGMHGSVSSGDSGSTVMTSPISSIDFEKSRVAKAKASRGSSNASKDPEKAMSHARHVSNHRSYMDDSLTLSYSDEDGRDDDGRQLHERKAVKILLFLCGPCVLLSALNTLWAIISLIITILSQPVHICAKRPAFGQQLAGLLGPALNLQLRSIYIPLPPHANEDASYHSGMLVTVHMLSPFLSLGVMFLAWVVAAYWICSAILGDPAGLDKCDDGRDTVLGLRGWWEKWLMRSVIEQ